VTDSVLDRVRRIAADVLGLPVEQITADSSPDTVERWDSLQHLNLLLALEQSFGLNFAPDEIERMLSIGQIVSLIQQKLARSPVDTGQA
jgi:acyl carrier protein